MNSLRSLCLGLIFGAFALVFAVDPSNAVKAGGPVRLGPSKQQVVKLHNGYLVSGTTVIRNTSTSDISCKNLFTNLIVNGQSMPPEVQWEYSSTNAGLVLKPQAKFTFNYILNSPTPAGSASVSITTTSGETQFITTIVFNSRLK